MATASGTYLAFDYGGRRVGVAVGDSLTRRARPLPAIANGDWKALDRVLADWRPAALVLGLPLNEDGSEQAVTIATRRFSRELAERYGLPIHECDERYSSRAADDALRDARASGRMTRRVRKGDRDGEAARVILEQWLSELPM
jgi:putative Holliday junction resolvase